MLIRMAGGFTGWKGDFRGFFLGLKANNSKAYFEAHRKQYEQEVKGPMVALLTDLEFEFGVARLSRPNRDIRFSADKSPYKINIYASTSGGYVALDAEGLVVGGGWYEMDSTQLARFREAVAAPASGTKLVAIVSALREKGYDVDGQELKRVPSPHAQDHPRGDLLRHKRLIYWKRWPAGKWIATVASRERAAQAWKDGADLNAWLGKHLDGQPLRMSSAKGREG
jgi:uncharacterized protein (TIGR02453 family)